MKSCSNFDHEECINRVDRCQMISFHGSKNVWAKELLYAVAPGLLQRYKSDDEARLCSKKIEVYRSYRGYTVVDCGGTITRSPNLLSIEAELLGLHKSKPLEHTSA